MGVATGQNRHGVSQTLNLVYHGGARVYALYISLSHLEALNEVAHSLVNRQRDEVKDR